MAKNGVTLKTGL